MSLVLQFDIFRFHTIVSSPTSPEQILVIVCVSNSSSCATSECFRRVLGQCYNYNEFGLTIIQSNSSKFELLYSDMCDVSDNTHVIQGEGECGNSTNIQVR